MKTFELTGAALDWAVAKAEGYEDDCISDEWNYSTNWAQGGPIIEREDIELRRANVNTWGAWTSNTGCLHGPTPLIAAMRCYVASKLGDEVEIPEELK